MIRTYSDPLIVLSSEAGIVNVKTQRTVITAEIATNGQTKEVKIHFYGKLAEEVSERVVPGMKFTYRGFIAIDGESVILVGQTFTPIA